jgi:hypothetical protein
MSGDETNMPGKGTIEKEVDDAVEEAVEEATSAITDADVDVDDADDGDDDHEAETEIDADGNTRMLPKKRRLCRYPGCTKVIKSQGHCQRHGARAKRCKVDGCDKQAQVCPFYTYLDTGISTLIHDLF